MSKKPEIKIYPEYKARNKFPDAWTDEPITIPAKVHNAESFKAITEGLKNWLKTSNGWPQATLQSEKKRTIHNAIKSMLGREPEAQDLEKVEELGYNSNISMICYDGKPVGFCEWYLEGTKTPFVFITPTKYFKDEKS